ncbi:MAG: hypothetical protein Q7R35_16000 [Elusimicrobiota bacterium]|nr:hypothetical protein [Elusimicrobiota bacterium]
MSKKSVRKNRAAGPQQARQDPAAVPPSPESGGTGGDSVKRRALWLLAAVLILSGYALLHKADPGGQNGWAILSPALLLCGYLLLIPAISYTYRR